MSLRQHTQSLYNLFPETWRSSIILGGGCLRAYYDNTPIKDIDCFFRSEEDYRAVVRTIAYTPGYTSLRIHERYCEYRHPGGRVINLVGFVFGNPREHLERFDFRCCQFVAWYDDEGRLQTDYMLGAANDADAKLLYIQNNNGTERTLRRICHYIEDYGYLLHPDQTVEQEDAFEDAFDEFDAHRAQGVHPSAFKEAQPGRMRAARRRLAALPVQRYEYPEA